MAALVAQDWGKTAIAPADNRVMMTQHEDRVRLHYRPNTEV